MNTQNIELIDIYDVWYQPWWKTTCSYVTFSMIVCLILVIVLYYLLKSGWFGKTLSFDQQALKDLNKLANQTYNSEKQIRTAYFQLTLIFKTYLTHRYQQPLLDKTDIEIIYLMQALLPETQFFVLEEFLKRASQIKFSHELAVPAMLYDDIHLYKNLLNRLLKIWIWWGILDLSFLLDAAFVSSLAFLSLQVPLL